MNRELLEQYKQEAQTWPKWRLIDLARAVLHPGDLIKVSFKERDGTRSVNVYPISDVNAAFLQIMFRNGNVWNCAWENIHLSDETFYFMED